MQKKYSASSHVSINVRVNGTHVHVTFTPLTVGGSFFVTDNASLQEALERHPRFGSLFVAEEPASASVADEASSTSAAKDALPGSPSDIPRVKVSCLDDAKEYLVEQFGGSRTRLRSRAAIEAAAAANGVVFEGLSRDTVAAQKDTEGTGDTEGTEGH